MDYKITKAEIIDEAEDKQLFKSIIEFKKIKYQNSIDFDLTDLPNHFKDYLKQKSNNLTFTFYISLNRATFFKNIFASLEKNKQIFITDILGIGKSISLFMLKFLYPENKFIYLNLDIIKHKEEHVWKNIIKYEFGSIFSNYGDFHEVMNHESIKNAKDYLTIIYFILKEIINKKFEIMIYLIIDQYKIEKDKNDLLKEIKNIILLNEKIKSIVCSSINDKKIRELVLKHIKLGNDTSFLYINNNLSYNINSKENELSKIFNLFDYLSLYIKKFESKSKEDYEQIKDSIKDTIIEKIKNYYLVEKINNYI